MLSQHVSWFLANSSRLPQAGDCHEFQPQTYPQQPQRKHPVQEPRQGLHVALGCQAAVSGPRGWPGAASSVWFSPSCPGTSDARLVMEAPGSWERHKDPTQLGWGEPLVGQTLQAGPRPRAHPRASPPAAQEPQQASSWPQSCFTAPSEPPAPGGTGRGTQTLYGGTRAQRDTHTPKLHEPPEPHVTSRDTRVHMCVHASHRCCPQNSLGTRVQCPRSPAQRAPLAG